MNIDSSWHLLPSYYQVPIDVIAGWAATQLTPSPHLTLQQCEQSFLFKETTVLIYQIISHNYTKFHFTPITKCLGFYMQHTNMHVLQHRRCTTLHYSAHVILSVTHNRVLVRITILIECYII